MADCHADRVHLAKGLCEPCYRTAQKKRLRAALPPRDLEAAKARDREYFRVYRSEWRAANPERERENARNANAGAYRRDPQKHRERVAAARYGLTVEGYRALLASADGHCECCGRTSPKTLQIDHDHATGRIRGVLCSKCNSALAYVHEDRERLEALIAYLDRHSSATVAREMRLDDLG